MSFGVSTDVFSANPMSLTANLPTTMNNFVTESLSGVNQATQNTYDIDPLAAVNQTAHKGFTANLMPHPAQNNYDGLRNHVATNSPGGSQSSLYASDQSDLSNLQQQPFPLQTTQDEVTHQTTHSFTELSPMPQVVRVGLSSMTSNQYGHTSSAVRSSMARKGPTVSQSPHNGSHGVSQQYNQLLNSVQPPLDNSLSVAVEAALYHNLEADIKLANNNVMDGEFRRPEVTMFILI